MQIEIPTYLDPLVREVADLRAAWLHRPADPDQAVRMALHTGLMAERDTLKAILEQAGEPA